MSRTRRPQTCAVLLAAGKGQRAGGEKQFRRAGGKSLLLHAAEALLGCPEVKGLCVVVTPAATKTVQTELDRAGLQKWYTVVAGGATRHESSRAGLAALPSSCRWVLIHDAARPFPSVALIRRVLRAARVHGAAMPVVPVHDSVIELAPDGSLRRYLDRSRLRAVQTPQAFDRRLLEKAFGRSGRSEFKDDASVMRRAGHPVAVVEGEPGNQKITTAQELHEALRRLRGRDRI